MRSVSVIIPVYNHGATVAEAINSALNQEFDGFVEIIATNDGSTDNTQEVLDSYGSRIKVVRQANRGNAAARNAAVAQSRGEYLAFLDADDIWLPGRISRTVHALECNPRAVLAFADSIPMGENGELGQPWIAGGTPSMEELLRRGWMIFPSATTIRRAAFDACGGFAEQLRGLVDVYFYMVAREHGEFEYLPGPLIIYRATNPARLADRYLAARGRFVRLVRERYGRAVARRLAADTGEMFANSLISKASIQRRDKAHLAALWTLSRAIWLMPSYREKVRLVQRLVYDVIRGHIPATIRSG